MKVLVKGAARRRRARGLLASRLRRHDADDRHRQQRRHDPHAGADGRFHQGQSRHQAQLGHARRERAAPEGDDRHRHQGRPVRRPHHRHLRSADLGQEEAGSCRSTSSAPTTTSTTSCPPSAPACRYDGKLYAAPFYGESSFVMYRTDLMEKAGLKMPEKPTWDFIRQAADKMTDKAGGVYGICLRGKPGWGENMAFLTAMSNSFGARWFDEKWKPQFNTPEWKKTIDFYVDLMKADGPPGASSQRLQREPGAVQRRQVRHVDRRHGRGRIRDRSASSRRSPTRSASRSRPTTGSARAPTGCGRGRWPSRPARARPTRRRSSSPGRPASTTPSSSPRRTAGLAFRPAPAPRSTRTRTIRRPRPGRS